MGFKIDMKAHGMRELSQALKRFGADIKAINRRSLMKVGLKAERIAVLHITAQDLGWAPLNTRYLAWKTAKGHSEKILVKSSTYLQSITSFVDGDSVGVGVKKDVKMASKEGGKEGGKDVTVESVARVLEFGSIKRGIPARPLWGPTLRETADWIASSKFFAQEIIKGLRKKYAGGSDAGDADAVGEVARPATTATPDRDVSTGKRGGRFYLNASGRKVYLKRK